MKRVDALKALGFGETENPSDEEIKKAFRRDSFLYHPDKNVNKDEAEKKIAEEKFKEISNAYHFLLKPLSEQRKIEAEENAENDPFFSGMDIYDINDIFSQFFHTPFSAFFPSAQPLYMLEVFILSKNKKIESVPYLLTFWNSLDLEQQTDNLLHQMGVVSDLSISILSQNPVPENILEGFVRSIERAPTLKFFDDPANLFSISQKQRIAEKINSNKVINNRAIWAFYAGVAVAGIAYAASATSFLISISFLTTYYAALVFANKYHQYATHAKSAYDSVDKIKQIVDPTEQAALQAGVKAENWTGYFQSYTSFSSYRKHAAFTAGKEIAMTKMKNKSLVDEIENLGKCRV